MSGGRFRVPAHRRGVLAVLAAAGLAVAGLGFVAASVDPGAGPRAVHGAVSAGPFYLPPFLTGLAALAMAGMQVRRTRWAPAAGALLAVVLLAGAVTLGHASFSWRLAHPGAVIGFTEDTAQLAGEITAIAAGAALTVVGRGTAPRAGRRRGSHRPAADRGGKI
jgi:hypothetical protein